MASIEKTSQPSSHLVSDPKGVRYRTDTKERVGKVVVAIDGSEASAAVLARGIQIATGLHASLIAVIVWAYPAYYEVFISPADTSPEKDAIQILSEVVAEAFHGKHPDWVTLLAREGTAANVLIKESAGAEMLIVGSRGHSGLAGLLLGSVSAECAERASCPVLVIH